VIRTRPPQSRRRQDFRSGPLTGVIRISRPPPRAPRLGPRERVLRCTRLVDAAWSRCLELRHAHQQLLARGALPSTLGAGLFERELSRSSERLHQAEASHGALTLLLCAASDEAAQSQSAGGLMLHRPAELDRAPVSPGPARPSTPAAR
jgi:hypothetical protein